MGGEASFDRYVPFKNGYRCLREARGARSAAASQPGRPKHRLPSWTYRWRETASRQPCSFEGDVGLTGGGGSPAFSAYSGGLSA